jgi:adenylate kinase family enzyme/nitrogen regulatory protein PII-like uncharacterized protein
MKKIMNKNDATFEYIEPKVTIPAHFRKQYNEGQIQKIEMTCLEQFSKAQNEFDKALAGILENDPEVLKFARDLAGRMIQLIDAVTELEVTEKVTKSVENKLKGSSKTDINVQIKSRIELEKNAALSRLIGQKTQRGGHVAVDEGYIADQGYPGMSPQAIRNVAKNGNVREAMYIMFRTPYSFMSDVLGNPHSDKLQQINQQLQKNYGWQVDIEFIEQMLNAPKSDSQTKAGINAKGAHYEAGFDREERSKHEQEKYRRENPPPLMNEVKLSEREKFVQTGEIESRQEDLGKKRLPWRAGSLEFKPSSPPKTPYSKAAELTKQPFVASLSGNADLTLTRSAILGLGSRDNLMTCRKACLGWLVSGNNHSADEVMLVSKSFHLPYTQGPEGYKDIDPENKQLIPRIEKKLSIKGKKLPPFYLSEENVTQVAQQLFEKSMSKQSHEKNATVAPVEDSESDLESKHAIGDVEGFYADGAKKYPEFEQRHIAKMEPLTAWSEELFLQHKLYNRILQNEFTSIKPEHLRELGKATKEDWLTDWLCPQIEAATKLHIAALLSVRYQISADDLNDITQRLFKEIGTAKPDYLTKISQAINEQLDKEKDAILKVALNRMTVKYPDIKDKNILNALLPSFVEVETQRRRMAIQNDKLMLEIDELVPGLAAKMGLVDKPVFDIGTNIDFSFIGAAGSGKSTISKLLITDKDKLNSVVLATDDYRGVVIDEKHEKVPTDQVFIRTQDTAYYIKELIQKRLERNPKQRSNIILDCITLESWHKNLLAPSKKHLTSVVACLDDISLVPERAYLRAIDERSGPADKGRQVHTTTLLQGHQASSTKLLSSLPPGVKSTLYDTNVPRGKKPSSFASVDLTANTRKIEVTNLKKLSHFLCKANVNIHAEYPQQLYFYNERAEYSYTFDKHHQAEQVLNMIKPQPHPTNPAWDKPPYDLFLSHNGKVYAKMAANVAGKIQLQVVDEDLFAKKLQAMEPDSKALTSLIMQIHYGSLDEVRKNIIDAGSEAQAARIAIAALVPRINHLSLHSEKVPPYSINLMYAEKTPTLKGLNAVFGGFDGNGRIKPITVIPLLIKDADNKVWVYGRAANGTPQLNELSNSKQYSYLTFSKTQNEVTVLKPNEDYQKLYKDLHEAKAHYYNYRVLVTDERKRRMHEHDKRIAEHDRQLNKMIAKESKASNPMKKSSRPSPVLQSGKLAAVGKDVLEDLSRIKPKEVEAKSDSVADEQTKQKKRPDDR